MTPTTLPILVTATNIPQMVTVSISILAFALSVAAFFVARHQSVTARYNLRLSLFDRRWKIYIASNSLLNEAAMGFCEMAILDPFQPALEEIRPSRFLLPRSTIALIEDIRQLVARADAQMRTCRVTRTEDPQAISKFQIARAELRPEIEIIRAKLDAEFDLIMGFRDVK